MSEDNSFLEKTLIAIERLYRTRLLRAYTRYTKVRSNLLAGGIAYTALFSLAGIITLLIISLRVVLHTLPQVQLNSIYNTVNHWLPGAIATNNEKGIVDPDMISTPGFTWSSVVAFIVAFVAGLRVVSALRVTVQEVFGLPPRAWAFLKEPVRDTLMFLVLGLGMLLSLIISSGTVVAMRAVQDWFPLHLPLSPSFINAVALLLTSLVTACSVALTLRYLAMVKAPRRDLWIGSTGFAAATTGMQMLGTYLATFLNPLIAPFAVLFTLILWVNIVSRLFLYTCCWIANPPLAPAPIEDFPHFQDRPNYVTLSAPSTLSWPHDPISGQVWSRELAHLAKEQADKTLNKFDEQERHNEDNHD